MRKGFHGPLAKSCNTPPPKLNYRPPQKPRLVVLYDDEDFVVLSKPAGLLSVEGKDKGMEDCLYLRVLEKFPTATVIHRLDRGTSGICVMALNPNAHRHLSLQFEKRQTEKSYIALVEGHVSGNDGTIEKALRTDWYNRPKQMIDTYMGREAITHWTVVKRHDDYTRMALNPKTGRSHQLRVHMQHIGHPILGDTFYQNEQKAECFSRMQLHAERLTVSHPRTGERVTFNDPCPF